MEVRIGSNVLADELALLQRIVDRKRTIPALSHVRMSADMGLLTFAATDQELSLTCELQDGVFVERVGDILLPAQKMHELMKLVPAGTDVRIAVSGSGATVQADRFNARLQAMSPEDFPALREPGDAPPVILPRAALVTVIDQAAYAMAAEKDARFFLQGAELRVADGRVTLSSTDGHRLARASAPSGAGVPVTLLLPAKTVLELRAMLDASASDDVSFVEADGQMFFTCGHRCLASRTISDGKFPSIQRVLDQDRPIAVSADRDRLALALRRASLATSLVSSSVRLAFGPNGTLLVSSASSEVGEASDEFAVDGAVPAEHVGMAIYFNPKYALEFLDAAAQGTVTVAAKDPMQPLFLRQADESQTAACAVVMPTNPQVAQASTTAVPSASQKDEPETEASRTSVKRTRTKKAAAAAV